MAALRWINLTPFSLRIKKQPIKKCWIVCEYYGSQSYDRQTTDDDDDDHDHDHDHDNSNNNIKQYLKLFSAVWSWSLWLASPHSVVAALIILLKQQHTTAVRTLSTAKCTTNWMFRQRSAQPVQCWWALVSHVWQTVGLLTTRRLITTVCPVFRRFHRPVQFNC